ncbi:MAG: NAD-dependent epimerase/dehydratase family protein [Solobacterium sp.]|nr:NAD-dependent epimerase/dehydratase family protein [Solobacterium sp.]
MRLLVYGTGVMGSFLTHTLLKAGHEVTMIASGSKRETLQRQSLIIEHRLQHKETADRPEIAEHPDEVHYDAVFSAVQGQEHNRLIPELAEIDTGLVVLVGNNPRAKETAEEFRKYSGDKSLLFGFQNTAGVQENGKTVAVYHGNGSMTVGGLEEEASLSDRKLLNAIFFHTGYQLEYTDHMDGWLLCHAAMVLPIFFVSYANDCNLRKVEGKTLDEMIFAIREGYSLLRKLGTEIRPKRDVEFLRSGLGTSLVKLVFVIMSKTMPGELAAADQCRIAVSEKEWMDTVFQDLKKESPEIRMDYWERLRERMPDWQEIHALYDF